jgi:nitroreductase
MNPIIKTINERRAVRKYKAAPIERNIIDLLLDAGRMAPSALHHQPWKFYVLTDRTLISDFDALTTEVAKKVFADPHAVEFLKNENPIFHGAPVVIFISCKKQASQWASLDIGMCSQNIMLAAKSIGLDTCPVGLGKFVEKTSLYPILEIPPDEEIQLAIIAGYGDEQPAAPPRKKDNVVYVEVKEGVEAKN